MTFKLIFYWIIKVICWIGCCQASSKYNLRSTQDEKGCTSNLMSRKLLSDQQFTASSYYQNKDTFKPSMARLLDVHSQSTPSDGSAWCPATEVHKDMHEWIEIDFGRMVLLTDMFTMGRGDGNFLRFCPEITIKYQRTVFSSWHTYQDVQNNTIIPINTDARNQLRTSLRHIVVRKIRIYPLSTGPKPINVCLKISFLGCFFEDDVVSYTSPQGDRGTINGQSLSFVDDTYDGAKTTVLENGLGLLMDNYFQRDFTSVPKNSNTVFTGWMCTKERARSSIILIFYYDSDRVFERVSLYYVTNTKYKIGLTSPIVVSIGYNNDTHRYIYNKTAVGPLTDYVLTVTLGHARGNICTLSLQCTVGTWIVLSEIQIISARIQNIGDISITKFSRNNTTMKPKINPSRDDKNLWQKEHISLFMAIGLAVILVMVLLSCVAFLFYKLKRLKKYKVNKKHDVVAECSKASFCDRSSRTVFSIPSKHTSISSMSRPQFYTDSKPPLTTAYSGHTPSDGVYASWPNTDEDPDVRSVDKDEEKCLLMVDAADSKSTSKDYAVYQPGVVFTGSEYFPVIRPSSTMSNVMNISEKLPFAVANPKIVTAFDLPKSTPMVTFRNCQNMISYQHLINFRGICGDVDLRCQSLHIRLEQLGLDSDIKIVSTSSVMFVQPWVRGQFGSIDLVTLSLDYCKSSRFFMKTLHPDSQSAIKSKFIVELKILSSLSHPNLAKLTAIVVENDALSGDIGAVIRSGKFCLLVENGDGYNLKEFLRNINYPNPTQKYKTTAINPPSQFSMSVSSMVLIISQISGALKHLEDLDLTHRDVGCRNCTIDARKHIKLYPGGYVTNQPFEDYCLLELQGQTISFPLRWMAPESIFKGLFTSKADVWSFGVTMWEIFTMCSIMPYPSLANEALLELFSDRDNSPKLPCPQNCPREMYELMAQCWSWDECKRPSLADINSLMQIKNTKATSISQLIMPAPPSPPSPPSSQQTQQQQSPIIIDNHLKL